MKDEIDPHLQEKLNEAKPDTIKKRQFEDEDVHHVLAKIEDPDLKSYMSYMTPSEQLDENGNKLKEGEENSHVSDPLKEIEKMEEEEEEKQEEGDEENPENDLSAEEEFEEGMDLEGEDEDQEEGSDATPELLKEEEDEDEELPLNEQIRVNITHFHTHSLNCLDDHFLKKPGEQLSYDKMMEDCYGEENIGIQKFYNDIDWQIKDYLRQTIRDILRPGHCDKVFMQCYEYIQNLEIFMSLDYNIFESLKSNLNFLLENIDVDTYNKLKELTKDTIVEYDEIRELLEEKKEFLANFFITKKDQYKAEYGALEPKDEDEEEESEEHEESEHSDEDEDEETPKSDEEQKKEIQEKLNQMEQDEKKKEFENDIYNVFNDKQPDGDAPFENKEQEPNLNDLVPGLDKQKTDYPDRPQGNAAIEVSEEDKKKALKVVDPEQRAKDLEERKKAEVAQRQYGEILQIRHELEQEEENSEYDEAHFFKTKDKGPGKSRKLKKHSKYRVVNVDEINQKKDKKIQQKVLQMLSKDLKKIEKVHERRNKRGKKKLKEYM